MIKTWHQQRDEINYDHNASANVCVHYATYNQLEIKKNQQNECASSGKIQSFHKVAESSLLVHFQVLFTFSVGGTRHPTIHYILIFKVSSIYLYFLCTKFDSNNIDENSLNISF